VTAALVSLIASGAEAGARTRARETRGATATKTAAEPQATPLPPRQADVVAVPGGWYRLESGPVSFGALVPDVAKELPGGVRARVFADRRWTLNLVPRSPLQANDGGAVVPHARLAWRSGLSAHYVALAGDQPVVVARGEATGPQGRLVVVDLRMQLDANDELGLYECTLDLILETEWEPEPVLGTRLLSKR